MRHLHTWGQNLWSQGTWQLWLAVCFGALVGVAAGRSVLSVSGSVSVVDGRSMSPTFEPGARVYTEPLSGAPQRGDVVLLNDGNKEYALKRIVGMPGETVQLWRGYVFINQKMLQESYLPKHTFTFPGEKQESFRVELGEDEFFVMGDNRLCSLDSRVYGPVTLKSIKSRVPRLEGDARATFVAYTLPAQGKRTIRPL